MATEIEKKQPSNAQNSRANEIVAVILLALAVLFFLCLISYSPADWSLNGTGQGNQKTQNWIGVVGAVVSDLLFQFIGLTAYIFPALLGLIAWRVFYTESLMPRASRIIGFLLLVISAPALIDLINLGDGGGMIGAGFARFFVYLLSSIGAGILLFTLLTAAILLLTNFSFFGFFGNFDVAWANFRIHFDEWLAKKREKREASRAAEQARLETLQKMHGDKSVKTAPSISLGEKIKNQPNGKPETNGAKISAPLESPIVQPEIGKEHSAEVSPQNEEIFQPTIAPRIECRHSGKMVPI